MDIRLHSIIYKVEEEIRNAMIECSMRRSRRRSSARPKSAMSFECQGGLGCGLHGHRRIDQADRARRLIRDNVVIFENAIGSLRRQG